MRRLSSEKASRSAGVAPPWPSCSSWIIFSSQQYCYTTTFSFSRRFITFIDWGNHQLSPPAVSQRWTSTRWFTQQPTSLSEATSRGSRSTCISPISLSHAANSISCRTLVVLERQIMRRRMGNRILIHDVFIARQHASCCINDVDAG